MHWALTPQDKAKRKGGRADRQRQQYAKIPKAIIKSAQAVDNTTEKTVEKIKSVVIDGILKGA